MAHGTLAPLLRYLRGVAGADGPGPLTDGQLLARYAVHGDEAAFAALVRRYARLVLAACRQVLSDDADIEDAFQATFLVLVRRAKLVRWWPSVGSWLFGVAHRIAVRARADARRRQRHEGTARAPSPIAADPPDLSWREACAILHNELDRLPDKLRLPLLLCYLDGRSRDEAARLLGWTVGAVKGRLERVRKRLRIRLERRGVTLSGALLTTLAAPEGLAMPERMVDCALNIAAGGTAGRLASQALYGLRTGRRLIAVLAAFALSTAGTGWGLWISGPAGTEPPAARPPNPPAAPDVGRPVPQETVTFRGQVLGPDGKPVPAAQLFTYQPRAGTPPANPALELAQRGVTDAGGRFRFDAPKVPVFPPGDQASLLPVVAAADGFGTAWAKVARAEDEVTLRLVPEQPIVGRVLDAEGRPAAGATVRVREFTRERTGRLDRFLTGWQTSWMDALYADIDGGLDNPPASAVRMTGPDREGKFRVTGIGVESVVLLDVHGPGLARAVLYVLTRPGFDPGPVNRATLERIPPSQRFPGQPPLLYGPSFDFVAQPAKPVEGTVREAGNGRPVAGARVSSSAGYNTTVETRTDAAGGFRLDGLPKRKDYHLYVQPPEGSPLLALSFDFADTEGLQPLRADVGLARGTVLFGRVIDRTTGQTVFADIHFVPLPDNPFVTKPAFAAYRREQLGTSTNPEGRFRFAAIPGPGVLVVRAHGQEMLDGKTVTPFLEATVDETDRQRIKPIDRGDGHLVFKGADGGEHVYSANVVRWLDLAEAVEPAPLDLFVDRGRTATIRVQTPDGRPLAGAVVSGMTAM
jgi:RNA polymerase sigma factor (sigma-70 family)